MSLRDGFLVCAVIPPLSGIYKAASGKRENCTAQGLSLIHISTTFMKNTNLLRIAYAKNYLCTTDLSIEEIAEKIGFTSSRALYKLFQQYEGLSLSQYRERHKKDN